MTARYLSLKEVAKRLGVTNAVAYRLPKPDAASSAAAAHASTRPNNKKTPCSQPCGWEQGYIQVLRQGRHSPYLVNRLSAE